MTHRRILHAAFALALLPLSAFAAPGFLGMSQEVDVGWTMNVESARVNAVVPDSPAARAGIAVGDMLMAIDSCVIPKCGAYKAKALMERQAGESVHLKLKHKSGEAYEVTLTAVERPQSNP